MRKRCVAWSLLIALVGCSGGALPSQSNSPTAISGRSTEPSLPATTTPVKRRRGHLTVHIRIPRARRHGRYVSQATKGISLAFNGAASFTQTAALTPNSPGCTGASSATTCTIVIALFAGDYTVTASTFDKAPVNGAIPGDANPLSVAKNVPLHVVAGIGNLFNVTTDGVPAVISISGLPVPTQGTPFSAQAFTVTVKDADAYTIVGTYETPITLSDSDTSGITTIATSGADNPPAGELLSSSDRAAMNYTGATLNPAITLTASAGTASGHATFGPVFPVPTLASVTSSSGLIGTSKSYTLTGTNFMTGQTTVNVSGTLVKASNVVATTTSLTVTLSIDAEAATGSRTVSVTTLGGTSNTQSFTVSNTGVDVVTLASDATPGSIPGTCPAGAAGDLRYAICNAAAGDTIVFDTTQMCAGSIPCTITLAGELPEFAQNQTVDGGTFGNVIIDGAGFYRAFWADTGTITIANLQIQNAVANGGAGANGSAAGGGGAGLGGGLFVNGAAVTVSNDYFLNDAVAGGNGGNDNSAGSAGGGGGLGGAGAPPPTGFAGGTGGGGVLTGGNVATGGVGFSGTGGGTAGVAGSSPVNGGNGGNGGGGGGGPACGSGQTAGNGGAGGFGGGGGGGGGSSPLCNAGGGAPTFGAMGGFGGGGGGGGPFEGIANNPGANGGAGGGGGGGSSGGSGGGLATISGGNGDGSGDGGSGAAAGPAIFIVSGSLTTTNSGASCTINAGVCSKAGTVFGSATAGGTDNTPVYNFGGTVNASSTTGPVASALSGVAPSLRHRERRADKRRPTKTT